MIAAMPSEPEAWRTYAPDWYGASPVEFLLADGSVVPGEFVLYDSVDNPEGSYPIWHVQLGDAEPMSFFDLRIKGWRVRQAPPGIPPSPAPPPCAG